jgi:hypothetical protein
MMFVRLADYIPVLLALEQGWEVLAPESVELAAQEW